MSTIILSAFFKLLAISFNTLIENFGFFSKSSIISSLGIKQTSISSKAIASKLEASCVIKLLSPRISPFLIRFTIWFLPFSLILETLQIPSFIQKMPFICSPSLKSGSPFLMVLEVLHADILTNSSLDKWVKELNLRTIHCSHLLIRIK